MKSNTRYIYIVFRVRYHIGEHGNETDLFFTGDWRHDTKKEALRSVKSDRKFDRKIKQKYYYYYLKFTRIRTK